MLVPLWMFSRRNQKDNNELFKSELQGIENVILTPHIGGSTEEAQVAIGREVSESIIRFLEVGSTTGAVNFPNVELPVHKNCHRILNAIAMFQGYWAR